MISINPELNGFSDRSERKENNEKEKEVVDIEFNSQDGIVYLQKKYKDGSKSQQERTGIEMGDIKEFKKFKRLKRREYGLE